MAALFALPTTAAHALMAGRAPDSPLRRLDTNSADSPHACVAGVMGGGGVYSAVCISPRFVLTAAHVVQDVSDLRLYLNLGGDLTHRLAIQRIVRHPGFGKQFNGQRPTDDLAVLELSAPVPPGLRFAPMAHTPATEGLRIELAGHGASGLGDKGVSVGANPALRRVGANRIDRLLRANDPQQTPLIYLFGFDERKSLGNSIETGLASGDSGSPAFVREAGGLAVLGINTFVAHGSPKAKSDTSIFAFGSVSGGQLLAPHRAWLLSVIGHGVWPGLG